MNVFKCTKCGRTWIETDGITKSECKFCERPLSALKDRKAEHIDENVYDKVDVKYLAE